MQAPPLYVAACAILMATLVHSSSIIKGLPANVQSTVADAEAQRTRASRELFRTASWCQQSVEPPAQWHKAFSQNQTVLGRPDVHTCLVLDTSPATSQLDGAYTQTVLESPSRPGLRLHEVLLLDCDASFWHQLSVEGQGHMCVAHTAALRASCNQWLLTPPADGQERSKSCAPPGTAFAHSADLQGRVVVLHAHWRLNPELTGTAVQLPALTVNLGAVPASAVTGPPAKQPVLLGSFVASAVHQPSSLFHSFPPFSVPGGLQDATASFMCGKRCTFLPLGRMMPKPVTVVGYSFTTFNRATAVSVEIQRGWAGNRLGSAVIQQSAVKAAKGPVVLDEPLQLMPGDIIRWRCTYDTLDVPSNSSILGGYSASSESLQEHCTVVLHYWPRMDSMRGCVAATVDGVQRGENMCSREAEELLQITQAEGKRFPMRRMYDEHSFPKSAWMGGWKATRLVLQMAAVLAVLWGSQTMLAKCTFLGSWHKRFQQLHPGQQRNVSVYITHLVLDTACVMSMARPVIELWLGLSETTADVLTGEFAFSYLVACYVLELTWRRKVDTMLAVHHIGTVAVVVLYAGELTPYTYRVAHTIIVLGEFAVLEQPTYVALLLKRMLPACSPHVYRSARVGYISWFALKILSVIIAIRMYLEDWHLMPNWIRLNFVLTWLVAIVVQSWSGIIQYGIYRQALRSYKAAPAWQLQSGEMKAGLLHTPDDSSSDGEDPASLSSPSDSPTGSGSSEDCIADVGGGEVLGNGFAPFCGRCGPSTLLIAAVQGLRGSELEVQLSPNTTGVSSSSSLRTSSSGAAGPLGAVKSTRSQGMSDSKGCKSKQVKLSVPGHQGLADKVGSALGEDEGSAGCSSGARVYHTEKGTSQRRSKSGLLNLIEYGLGGSRIAGQEGLLTA